MNVTSGKLDPSPLHENRSTWYYRQRRKTASGSFLKVIFKATLQSLHTLSIKERLLLLHSFNILHTVLFPV